MQFALDEKKDIEPLLLSKKRIEFFLDTFPETDYAIDLKFKLDLIINQLAAKELSIARFYIQNEKWIDGHEISYKEDSSTKIIFK